MQSDVQSDVPHLLLNSYSILFYKKIRSECLTGSVVISTEQQKFCKLVKWSFNPGSAGLTLTDVCQPVRLPRCK